MAYLDRFTGNCGMRILYGLSSTPAVSLAAVATVDLSRTGIIAFTDAANNGNGTRLAEYIKTQKLGKVMGTPEIFNPNSRRRIQAWYWKPNKAALKRWRDANPRIAEGG